MAYYAPEKVRGAKTDQLVGDEMTSFERWAERLARDKGFTYLSEEDVAYIVHESRFEQARSLPSRGAQCIPA
jgi:hypothetical protein